MMYPVLLQAAGIAGALYCGRNFVKAVTGEKVAGLKGQFWMMGTVASFGLGAMVTTLEHRQHPDRPDAFRIVYPLLPLKNG